MYYLKLLSIFAPIFIGSFLLFFMVNENLNTNMGTKEIELIRETAQLYIDGLKYSDTSKFEKAFHPDFQMHGLDGKGEFQKYSRNSFIESIDSASESSTSEPQFEGGIVNVDHYGRVATVKIQLANDELIYTDYLSLVKVGHEWSVIHKIWDTFFK